MTPGPGAYDPGGERAQTSVGYGAAFPKTRRTAGDLASYASLRSVGKTPGPGEYSPFDRDTTMSMQAASALAERCPRYDRPEVDNPDHLFLTAMRDPWTMNQGM